MSDTDIETIRQRWTRRLSGLRRRLRWQQAAEAVAVLLAGIVVAVLISGLVDYRLELSVSIRRGLIVVGTVVLAWAAWRRLIRPLVARLDLLDVAALVDRATGGGVGSREKVVSSSASSTADQQGAFVAAAARVLDPAGTESPLVRKAIAEGDEQLSKAPLNEAVSGRHLGQSLLGSVVAVVIPVCVILATPAVSKVWAARWIGGEDTAYPRDTSIAIVGLEDGVIRVPRGEPARIAARVTDKDRETQVVWLRLQPSDGDRLTSTLDVYGREGNIGDFRGDLPALGASTPASVWGGDARPVRFVVEPVDRPQVIGLDLVAKHPAEAEASQFDLTTATDVRLLKDSKAALTVTSTVPVSAEFDTPVDVHVEQTSPTVFKVSWIHREPIALRVALTSTESGLESFPRTVPIGLLPDRPPSVTLRHSGVRLRVTKMATIPLSVTARDDFGVARVSLNGEAVRLVLEGELSGDELDAERSDESNDDEAAQSDLSNESASDVEVSDDRESDTTDSDAVTSDANTSDDSEPVGSEPVDKDVPEETEQKPKELPKGTGDIELYVSESDQTELRIDREHRLDLTPLDLKPGDVVKVTATAFDAAYGGAQERKSRTITFRIVKEEDLFREILLRLQQLRSRLRKATDASDVLRTELLTAELPKEASLLSRKYQVTRREVGAVTQQIKLAVTEMTLNQLGGEEAEEMNELIDRTVVRPLERLLAGAMDRQRVTLGELAKSQGAQLTEDRGEAAGRQQEIVDSLNEVLNNMNQWDSFVDVVNQLNAVIGIERDVRTRTEELRTGETADVIDPIGSSKKPGDPKEAADDIFDLND